MPIIPALPWKDLETKGFIHVSGFLSAADVAACRDDYTRQPVDENNKNNAVSVASELATSTLQPAIEDLMARVRTNTAIRVDANLGSYYFATTRGVFPWHQDHESWFTMQNHWDYLNLFIPIVKPRRDKSNLCIVPFDVLERESPKPFRRLVRSGAMLAYDLPDRQLLFQSDSGVAHVTRVPLERLAFIPQLEGGDMLIMRGDILHRTQDGDTERVALSIRLGDSQTIVRRSRLADGGLTKMRTMAQNLQQYEPIFRAFDRAKRDELPWSELYRLIESGRVDAPPLPKRPRRYLLQQKIRSGVFLSSALKVVNEVVRNQLLVKYHTWQASKAAARPPRAEQSVELDVASAKARSR
jgi:hypothetical protein